MEDKIFSQDWVMDPYGDCEIDNMPEMTLKILQAVGDYVKSCEQAKKTMYTKVLAILDENGKVIKRRSK
jgi:hypothetical protein